MYIFNLDKKLIYPPKIQKRTTPSVIKLDAQRMVVRTWVWCPLRLEFVSLNDLLTKADHILTFGSPFMQDIDPVCFNRYGNTVPECIDNYAKGGKCKDGRVFFPEKYGKRLCK